MSAKKTSFLIDDFISDTFSMNCFQKGCYMNLIAGQSKRGRLSEQDIKQILSVDYDKGWKEISYAFTMDKNGNYYIESMDKNVSKSKKLRENAMKRWNKSASETTDNFSASSVTVSPIVAFSQPEPPTELPPEPPKQMSPLEAALAKRNAEQPLHKVRKEHAEKQQAKALAKKKANPKASAPIMTARPKDTPPPLLSEYEYTNDESVITPQTFEEKLKLAFDENFITVLKMQYKIDVDAELKDFIAKTHAMGDEYKKRDVTGLKHAFRYQVRQVSERPTSAVNFKAGYAEQDAPTVHKSVKNESAPAWLVNYKPPTKEEIEEEERKIREKEGIKTATHEASKVLTEKGNGDLKEWSKKAKEELLAPRATETKNEAQKKINEEEIIKRKEEADKFLIDLTDKKSLIDKTIK